MDNKDVWIKQEAIAKAGHIDLIVPFLVDEFRKRVTGDVDPEINIEQLFINSYNKDSSYSLYDFLIHFVIMFNQYDIKAKPLK